MAELDVSGMVSTEPERGTAREDDRLYYVNLTFVPKNEKAFDVMMSGGGLSVSGAVSRDAVLEARDTIKSVNVVSTVNGEVYDELSDSVYRVLNKVHEAEQKAIGKVGDGIVPPRIKLSALNVFNYECGNNSGNSCVTEKVLLDEYVGSSGSHFKVTFDRQHASDGSTVDRLKFEGLLHKDQAEALVKGIIDSKGLQDFELEDYYRLQRVRKRDTHDIAHGMAPGSDVQTLDGSYFPAISGSHHAFMMYSQQLTDERREEAERFQKSAEKAKELEFMKYVGDECISRGLDMHDERGMALGAKIHDYEKLFHDSDRFGAVHARKTLEFMEEHEPDHIPNLGRLRENFERNWKSRVESLKTEKKELELPVEVLDFKKESNDLKRGSRSM